MWNLAVKAASVCVVAVPGDCADWCGGGDRRLLILPGGKELQDHGVVQEHGATVRVGRTRE